MPFLYFIVLVGVLVFVHELGHFACAKYFGVRVLTVSLGFGPRIAGFRRRGTDYLISALPLGGYVRMLGENPHDDIRPQEQDSAFGNQSALRRITIAVAGPAMNLVFPVLLYFVVFLGDSQLTPATVGTVFPGRPAAGHLQPGDRILSVDGQQTETFYDVSRIVERSAGKPLRFDVQRGDDSIVEVITPVAARKARPLKLGDQVGRVGIMPHHPMPIVGVTSPASPAGAARLKTFDHLVSVAGEPVDRWIDLERTLARNRGTLVPLTYLRPKRVEGALGGLVEMEVYEPRVATLTPEPGRGRVSERTGLESADLYVSEVLQDSPEHRLGLLPGDRLLELDGRPVKLWATFIEDLKAAGGAEHLLSWRRADERLQGSFSLKREAGVDEYGQVYQRHVVFIRNWIPARVDDAVANPGPIAYALREAYTATKEMVELTIFSVVRLVQGQLTVKSIGGPLTVFEVAGTAAAQGALNYLSLMAFISINLGLINLLPIPMLDGGHIAIFLIEAIMRRPLSRRVREVAHIVGLALLLAIMVLAFKNDIERQWPQIVDQFATE